MRGILVLIGLVLVVLVVLIMTGFINIDQTRTAQLPKVRIEGGQAPAFKADVGRVDVGTENRTVEVPNVDVQKAGNPATAQ